MRATEIALARVLRAWDDWPGECHAEVDQSVGERVMRRLGDMLCEERLISSGGPTKAGEALLEWLAAHERGSL